MSKQEVVVAEEQKDTFKFFRYVRPLDDHPKSFGRLAPHGGATFYIEFTPDDEKLVFSFTICRDDESFVKQFARDQTMDRFIKGEVFVIENYDTESWVVDNILFALHSYLGYASLAFKPKNYPVTLPVFTSVPSTYGDGNMDQTLELLLARLLRDHEPFNAHEAEQFAFKIFKKAYNNLLQSLVV